MTTKLVRYGYHHLRRKGETSDLIAAESIADHHYQVALRLASRGIHLNRNYAVVETREEGGTYLGWEAHGWADDLLRDESPA